MSDGVSELYREFQELRREMNRMRKQLLRQGTVESVDTAAGTVVITYTTEDVKEAPQKSNAMPWLQRASEHRPPAAGDHALVIDPSLGGGAAVCIVGWPSTAKPPPDSGGAQHVLFAGDEHSKAKIISPSIELGVSPTDMAALASKTNAEFKRIWDLLSGQPSTDLPPLPPWVPLATDGGAALLTAATAWKANVEEVDAEQVKVK